MSTTMMVILGLGVVALVIGVILAAGGDRPRVTTIERTTERAEGEEEEDRT